MTINCKDFHDEVTPFIDNELDKEKRTDVEVHAEVCPECNHDLVIEKNVKKIVYEKTSHEVTPTELRQTILKRLANRLLLFRIKEAFIWLIKKPVYSIAVIGVLISLILLSYLQNDSNDFVSQNFDKNVVAQSIVNFQNIKSHRYPSKTILNSDLEIIKGFLIANGFNSPIFPKTNWKLIGAGINQAHEIDIAHIVYESNEKTIYIYQVPCSAILKDKKLFLAEALLKNVADQDFYVLETDSCTTVLRVSDGTFASFVMDPGSFSLLSDLIESFKQ